MMSNTQPSRPLPTPTHYSKPFWDAAASRKLVVQACNACQRTIMYPKRFCPGCFSADLGWREATGRGVVYTYTVQERGAPSGFADRVPLVIAVIALDEGVQMMSNIVGANALEVACGDRVEVDFEEVAGTGVVLPVFRLSGGPGAKR